MFAAGTAVAASVDMMRTRGVVLLLVGVAACGSTNTVAPTTEAAGDDSGAEADGQVTDASPDRNSGCAAGSSLYYATGGCSAQPACLGDSQDACLGVYCGCDGVTFNDGCDYSRKAFAKRGPCGDGGDAAADANVDPCAGACGQAQQCVEIQGTTTSVCAGAHCGSSTLDGSACPGGQMCRTVTYDPCPPPPPGQARCNIASVTYDACVSGVADASGE